MRCLQVLGSCITAEVAGIVAEAESNTGLLALEVLADIAVAVVVEAHV